MKRSHKFGIGLAMKTYSRRIFTSTPKTMAWEKASNLRQLIEYGRQSEARNCETAQHIDKRLSYVSSRINALQKGIKLGPSPHGVFCNLGITLLNYKWSAKNLRVLFNSAKFSAALPLFGDWKYASTVAYCRPGGRLFVAILPDNCHPSSWFYTCAFVENTFPFSWQFFCVFIACL